MRTRNTLTAAGLVVLLGAALAAQQKPNFSGRWSPADGKGREQVVEHTATSLTIGDTAGRGGRQFVYKLDGTETRNVTPSHAGDIVTVSKVSWDGNRIVLTSTTNYPDGRRRDDKQTWSLDGEGRLLVEHARGGAAPTKAVYTKQ